MDQWQHQDWELEMCFRDQNNTLEIDNIQIKSKLLPWYGAEGVGS